VRCLAERHGLEPGDVLVVYDEVALPLGRLRVRPGGSPGGHRGMESVVENLRTDRVPRLRLGCGAEEGPPPADDLVEYVLSPFRPEEREAAGEMVERAADACRAWLGEGIEAAMNRYN
jgi:PTH1 family peptidyl-tRNA hydrolase